jgi:hypothetical protein
MQVGGGVCSTPPTSPLRLLVSADEAGRVALTGTPLPVLLSAQGADIVAQLVSPEEPLAGYNKVMETVLQLGFEGMAPVSVGLVDEVPQVQFGRVAGLEVFESETRVRTFTDLDGGRISC